MFVHGNIQARWSNHWCCGNVLNDIYSEVRSVTLVIRHAMRTRHIVICGLPRPTIFFPRCLINGMILEKKVLNIKCVLISSMNLSDTFLIPRRTGQDMIKNVYRSLCKVPVILV